MAIGSSGLIICILNLILEAVIVFTQSVPASQVCIIGAGSSGLATARYMRELGLNFKIFEATRHIGGVWRFDPRVGTDEDGLPMFPTSYKNMRANGVLETLEYAGFPFPKGIRSFPSATCINKYLRSFTNHFNLKKYIQFQTLVTNVLWTDDKWNVTYMRTDTRKNASESCDFVVVASGEFSAPNVPHFKQQEEFKGKIIHSIDYKDSEDFRDLRVLVIGVGPSGLDVVAELINVTSTTLHSHHFTGELQEVPGNYVKKPDIKHFTPNGAVFVDDSTEEFDTVILCTDDIPRFKIIGSFFTAPGYTFNLPFLDYKSAGVAATKKYVMPLYNQVVNINHPSMTFVGFGKHSIGVVHDKQAHYSAQLAAARIKLPSQEVMLEHWFNQTRNVNITNINVIGYLATNQYLEALLKDTNIDRASPIIIKIIIDILTYWQISFLNFRDYEYQVLSDTQFVKTYKLMKEVCPIDI